MKKVINNYRDLIEWSVNVLLNDEFLAQVSCPKVTYYFTEDSFDIDGELTVNDFDLSELPQVLKKADALYFYAKNDMLKFRAHFQADGE